MKTYKNVLKNSKEEKEEVFLSPESFTRYSIPEFSQEKHDRLTKIQQIIRKAKARL